MDEERKEIEMANAPTSTRERALALLSTGVPAEQVAAACGVTPSAISQLCAQDDFSQELSSARFENLSKHNVRDSKYDTIEDALVDKLQDMLPMMMRPMEVLKSIQVINSAKRRGQSADSAVTAQQTVVQIVMPTIVVNRFTANAQNQVVIAGGQDLSTIQSGTLLKQVKGEQHDALTKRITESARDFSNSIEAVGS